MSNSGDLNQKDTENKSPSSPVLFHINILKTNLNNLNNKLNKVISRVESLEEKIKFLSEDKDNFKRDLKTEILKEVKEYSSDLLNSTLNDFKRNIDDYQKSLNKTEEIIKKNIHENKMMIMDTIKSNNNLMKEFDDVRQRMKDLKNPEKFVEKLSEIKSFQNKIQNIIQKQVDKILEDLI